MMTSNSLNCSPKNKISQSIILELFPEGEDKASGDFYDLFCRRVDAVMVGRAVRHPVPDEIIFIGAQKVIKFHSFFSEYGLRDLLGIEPASYRGRERLQEEFFVDVLK